MNDYIMEPTGVIVGDELGQIKKIDLLSKSYTSFNLTPSEPLHPSKCVVSISPLSFNLLNNNFLIANKANSLFIFDSLSDELVKVEHNIENNSSIVCSQCIDDQNIVIGFKNGSIYRINIEKDLCFATYKPNNKALNLLGIENLQPQNIDPQNLPIDVATSKSANESINREKNNNILNIFEPNWNIDSTYLTCFKACFNRLAIGGFNSDLKVFDITTGKNTFTAKSNNTDWLGIKHNSWISGLDWIGNGQEEPNLVATCSRTDPCVKVYDIKERQRKPIMSISIKNLNNANNESNLPSLTSICSLPSLTSSASPSASIVVGTTLGRMLAFDLRLKTRSSKILGGFNGFSGGSIRDIKYVRDSQTTCKIFSCSLDRFVRVHTLAKNSRLLDKKVYIKTKPTCLYPIVLNTLPKLNENTKNADDDDEFF